MKRTAMSTEELRRVEVFGQVATLQRPPRQALPIHPRGHFNRGRKGDILKEV